MSADFFQLMQAEQHKNELEQLVSCNCKTEPFGVSLTPEQAKQLMAARDDSLKKYRRVEFGKGILDHLVEAFCDSQYIYQEIYLTTLEQLQDIFYEYKNEADDQLTDDELITFMREQFETVCFGDLDYLEGTCLERFATAIRAGYTGYQENGMSGAYEPFDQENRWDKQVYLEIVKELFW